MCCRNWEFSKKPLHKSWEFRAKPSAKCCWKNVPFLWIWHGGWERFWAMYPLCGIDMQWGVDTWDALHIDASKYDDIEPLRKTG